MKLIAFRYYDESIRYYLWEKGKANTITVRSIKLTFDYFNHRTFCTTYKRLIERLTPDVVSVTTLPYKADFNYVRQNYPELFI